MPHRGSALGPCIWPWLTAGASAAELFSDDDLYLLDNNITIISTTNKIFNDELFKLLHPETLVNLQLQLSSGTLQTLA